MRCDIVVPVWNLRKYTKRCVESLVKYTEYPFRLIMVDNGSEKPTKEYLESLKTDARLTDYALIRNEKNLGYTKATNQGMGISDSEYVCLLNNDTVMTKGWLTEMVRIAESSRDIGIVNPASNNLGIYKPWYISLDRYAADLNRRQGGRYIEMATAVGFCFLIKREVIKKIGILSDQYGDGNFEDTEYAIRAGRNGYKSVIARGSYVYHKIHGSFDMIENWTEMFDDNQEMFYELFGKPERILYVFTRGIDEGYSARMKDETYELAKRCNWITVFIKDPIPRPNLAIHTNITVVPMTGIFFGWRCVAKILTKKKKYGQIFVDDGPLFGILTRLKHRHRANVVLIGKG